MFISLENKVINTEEDILEIVEMSIGAERYAKDVSRKTRNALRELMESGRYIGKGLYGYDVYEREFVGEFGEAKKKRTLIVKNDSSAEVVRRIFSMYLNGFGYDKIAKKLSHEEIISPSGDNKWCGNTIKMILENPLYGGMLEQGRYKKVGYKKTGRDKKVIKLDRNEWIGEEEFQGIISKEIFYEVQKQIAVRSNKGNKGEKPHLFSGLLRCAECGKALVYKKKSKGYKCSGSQDGSGCSTHLVKEEELIELVKERFQQFHFDEVNLEERLLKNYNQLYEIDKVDTMIKLKVEQRKKYYNRITVAELDYDNGRIEREELDVKCENYRSCIKKINQDIESIEDKKRLISKIEEQVKQILIIFKNFKIVDNGILKLLIKKINVYQYGQIEIIWNMKNKPSKVKKSA
jgi:ssDNA-binding Zn-finger/Zn-ribbon topoisomerase 1